MFPTKILLATDGSKDSELAATTAVGLAKGANSELHAATIAADPLSGSPYYAGSFPETAVRYRREAREEARQILDEQLEKVGSLGGAIAQGHLRLGDVAEEIVSLAEELGAGLVVLGSRGRGKIRRLLMGSVSDAVVRHAHCPVLVAREEREEVG